MSLLIDPSTRVEVPEAPKPTRDELLKKVTQDYLGMLLVSVVVYDQRVM